MNSSFGTNAKLEKLKKNQIKFLNQMIDELRKELNQLVGKDVDLKERINKLTSIPGVRDEKAIIVVSETNGFSLFQNIRQVVSFAGLDVSHNESGLFKGRSKISKKGNSKLRQVLYMPALTATRFNEPIKQLYQRICEKNPTTKRKGIVASMRKLLILMFVLWKKMKLMTKTTNGPTRIRVMMRLSLLLVIAKLKERKLLSKYLDFNIVSPRSSYLASLGYRWVG